MNRRDFCLSAAAVAALQSARSARSLRLLLPLPLTRPSSRSAKLSRLTASGFCAPPTNIFRSRPSPSRHRLRRAAKAANTTIFPKAITGGPIPKNPNGPYIRRDGYSNPQNFNDHREALIRLSLIVPALMAAWLITQDKRYARARRACICARGSSTPRREMNPSLDYAQAIWGVSPGRGTGIIDTLHLVEVTRAARHLERRRVMTAAEFASVRDWFAQYLFWMIDFKERPGRGGGEE